MLVTIKDRLFKDIQSYCSINDLDIEAYINDILKKSFMIEKYGAKPSVISTKKAPEPIKNKNNVVVVLKGDRQIEDFVERESEFPPEFTNENASIPMEKVIFPQLKNIEVDFSKQEELKTEIPMSHDIDEETLNKLLKDNVKQKRRKLTKK